MCFWFPPVQQCLVILYTRVTSYYTLLLLLLFDPYLYVFSLYITVFFASFELTIYLPGYYIFSFFSSKLAYRNKIAPYVQISLNMFQMDSQASRARIVNNQNGFIIRLTAIFSPYVIVTRLRTDSSSSSLTFKSLIESLKRLQKSLFLQRQGWRSW